MVSSIKLHKFSHERSLYKRVLKKLGMSKRITDSLLAAYSEFVELKIIYQDYKTSELLPSWCINQVWKLHVLDTKGYAQSCRILCGQPIHYHPDFDDQMLDIQKIQLMESLYHARYNRKLSGSVWYFEHVKGWWRDYTMKPTVVKNEEETNNGVGMAKKKIFGENVVKRNQEYNPLKPNSFYKLKTAHKKVEEPSTSLTAPTTLKVTGKLKRRSIETTKPIVTRSMAKKQRLAS